MPRIASSNGIKPQYRALSVIKLNTAVTPKEINDKVGAGDYAAKYISFLKKDGFVFTTQKDGRQVVSYTLVKEPENATLLRTSGGKQAVATAQGPKNHSNLVRAPRSNVYTQRPAHGTKKFKDAFGSNLDTGEVTGYAVDAGFDRLNEGPISLRDLGLDL